MPPTFLQKRLQLFPHSTQLIEGASGAQIAIGGCQLFELAREYGTPLYLYDQETLNAAAASYRQVLEQSYPAASGITYAGKAFLCLGLAQWALRQGLWLDCTGAGELHIAAAAGAPRASILVHGVNKSQADVQAALRYAGTIVVDNLGELQRLAAMVPEPGAAPDLWLRLRPGIAVDTHAYTQTGQEDSKFGMRLDEITQAVRFALQAGLPLTGLHFHQGSHFHNPAPLQPAIRTTLEVIAHLRQELGWMPEVLCPGGGWGVPYHEDDLPHPTVEDYVRLIATTLIEACQQHRLPLPKLHLEPGRSLVARAGVAIYQVGATKHSARRRWLMLDGGLADNPRPALYHARYSALPVQNPERPASTPAWLGGPYCESGDVLIEDLLLPDLQPGEYLAVPVSGAYQLSMSSNYNGARRPAVLWLHNGQVQVLQRRETLDELLRRDCTLTF